MRKVLRFCLLAVLFAALCVALLAGFAWARTASCDRQTERVISDIGALQTCSEALSCRWTFTELSDLKRRAAEADRCRKPLL